MEDWINYITFDSDQMQVFYVSKEVDTLEFAIGNSDEEKRWQKVGKRRIIFGGNRGKLFLRATNNKYGTNGATFMFGTDAKVVCTGDIRTLIDYKNYENANTSEAMFYDLFRDCKQLLFPPELYSSELVDGSYMCMFEGCTSLKVAPELPAKKMADHCYMRMFKGCTSLETPPELPALQLAFMCYYLMFEGCTSLKESPNLPAEKMVGWCYSSMFEGCTSLKKAPVLPAEKLDHSCYQSMFKNCTSLEEVFRLRAKELADYCYASMFQGCSSLVIASLSTAEGSTNYCCSSKLNNLNCNPISISPFLPAKKLAKFCYSSMFQGCTSLIDAIRLPAEELTDSCYECMFKDCTSLQQIYMMAIDIKAKECLKDWLTNTAGSGTLFKNKQAKWEDKDIIPNNWEIKEIDPEQLNNLIFMVENDPPWNNRYQRNKISQT